MERQKIFQVVDSVQPKDRMCRYWLHSDTFPQEISYQVGHRIAHGKLGPTVPLFYRLPDNFVKAKTPSVLP